MFHLYTNTDGACFLMQDTTPTYDKDQHEFLLHQLDLYIALCWVSDTDTFHKI